MSKPLTIDELKALEVGDWVWLVYKNTVYRRYTQIQAIEGTRLYVWGRGLAECEMKQYSDYGKTWLAYKNKEQEECKVEYKEYSEIYDYLYDYLNNAATCITQKDTNVVRIEVDAWLEFDLVIDLSDAKYFDDDTMTWKELRGAK